MRLVLFYDAGQVRDIGEKFAWKESHYVQQYVPPATPVLSDPFASTGLRGDANQLFPDAVYQTVKVGETSAFKSSTGAEIRFFMPVLNVPFRLIFAMNPQPRRRARQQPAAREEVEVPVRRRLDVLTTKIRYDSAGLGHRPDRLNRRRGLFDESVEDDVRSRGIQLRAAAGPAFAQAAGTQQQPPATPPAAGRPRRRPEPPKPFPEGAKFAFVDIQVIASTRPKARPRPRSSTT